MPVLAKYLKTDRTKNIFCTKQNWFLEGSSIFYNLLSFRQFMLHAPVLEILKYTFSDHVHPSSGHGFSLR